MFFIITLKKKYLISLVVILVGSFYPLFMGITVVKDLIRFGTIYGKNYPKYVIPYTPIALALIIGVAILPLLVRLTKKHYLLVGSFLSLIVFAASELILENQLIVAYNKLTKLESMQMYMCYIPPEKYSSRHWTEVNVLMGEYSPAFKIHFYIIAALIILSLLNSFYGFITMNDKVDKAKKKALFLQTVLALIFLGLCILACFTAFYRTGEINISLCSACLMTIYFIIMGMTAGTYTATFLLTKKKIFAVILPSIFSSLITLIMYLGEMILLSGHLYRFGTGFFFDGLNRLVLAPIDICIILASGILCCLLLKLITKKKIL